MSAGPQTATEVILIDPSVSDYKTLIAGLSPDIPVILLPEGGDGLANLAEALSGYQNLSSVHLVSHGSSGQLQLGDQPINAEALSAQPDQLQKLAQVFAPGADLMIYGCTVAAGEQGEAFVGQLSDALGGVDIAASDDRTGPLSLGGDWDLEYQEGEIESVLPFDLQGMQQIDHCLGCSSGIYFPGPTDDGTCGDSTSPRVSSIDRQSPTSETTNADSLTFSVAFSESVKNVDASDFSVSGTTATVTSVSGSGSSYTVTVSGGDLASLEGTVTLGFAGGQNIQDSSNNSLSNTTPTGTNNNSYTLDNTAPAITSISIPNTAMKVGDTVTVTITVADDGGDTYTNLSGTIGGFTLGALSKTNNTTYTAQFTVTDGGSDVAAGSDIPVNFTLSDSAGNTSAAFNTAISQASDSIDANIPVISSVSIPDQAYNVGDAITVTIVAGEAGLTLNSGLVNGVAVTGFSDEGSGTYTATYTVQEGDTDRAAGDAIPVSFVLDDAAGNSSATYSTAISQSADAIDANAPSVNSVSIPNTSMKVGDTVTVTITVADDGGDTYTNLSGTVGGFALSALSRTDSTTYTAQFTVTEGGTDVAAGSAIPVNFTLDDSAGNTSAAFTTAISQGSDSIDANRPVISSVSIPDQAYNVGDAITVTIVAGEAGLSLNTGTVNGVAVTGFSDAGGGTYTATYTVQEGDTDRAAGDSIPVSFVLDDAAGNSSATYSTAISQSADAIDANAPSVSSVSIPNTNMKVGDTVTVTITVADDGGETYTNLSGTVGGFALSALSRTDNTTYTAQFTVTEGGSDIEAGSDIPVNLTLTDSAGNTSSNYITAITQNADELDANSPGTPTGTLDIDENSANTTAVGAVTGGGSDGITYTLTDTAGGRFAIDTSGNLTVADGSLLDFETDTSHNITVRATDNAGNFTDNTLQVSVNDVNDAPTATNTTESMSYNASYTFTADDFGFSDVDTGDTLDHITIKTLPAAGHLTLDGLVITAVDTQVTLTQLTEGKLLFVPATNGTGDAYASFTFTVSDGTDDSVTPNTVTLNVGARPTPPPTPEPEPEPQPESEEDLVISPTGVSGDGNDDGVPDRDQADVASIPFRDTPVPSQEPNADPIYVSLTGGTTDGKSSAAGSGVTLSNVRQLDKPDDAEAANLDMPLGLIAFDADIEEVGGTETFSLYVDDTLSINGYWKQDASGEWVNLASANYGGKVVLEGSKLRLDFQITDGGEFDKDGEANGKIVDPGALAFGSDDYTDLVQSLYIAYYQRPADSAGLDYWVDYLIDQDGSLENVVDAFANSDESQALYGEITNTSISGFLGDLYRALFDRSPEVDGLMFYRNAFLAGEYEDGRPATAGTLMLDILQGAQNSDAELVELKLDAARTFTWLLDPDQDGEVMATFDASDLNDVRDWLQGLAGDDAAPGVGAIYSLIKDEVAEAGEPITLVGDNGVTELLF